MLSKCLSLFAIVTIVLLTACAPTGNSTKANNTDEVTEFVINNLTSNKWCQKKSDQRYH